jgi:hypothetical protein
LQSAKVAISQGCNQPRLQSAKVAISQGCNQLA